MKSAGIGVASTVAATGSGLVSMLASAPVASQESGSDRLYYLWRHYELAPGIGGQACDEYFSNALIPAANRLGIRPIGAFNAWFAPTEALGKYLLLPSVSLELVANLDSNLAQDAAYVSAAEAFLASPLDRPPFVRMESTLMYAMEEFPELSIPSGAGSNPDRIFEFRTYEQPTERAHNIKMDMFQYGEDEVLRDVGFTSIMYAKNLIGRRLPAMSYMWIYDNLDQRQQAEQEWFASEDRIDLFNQPRFSGTNSLFGNILLRPASYSQI